MTRWRGIGAFSGLNAPIPRHRPGNLHPIRLRVVKSANRACGRTRQLWTTRRSQADPVVPRARISVMANTPLPIPPELNDVFRGSYARNTGLVTDGQLRGPSFRRLFQDVYVRSDTPVTHELRCRGAALIVPKEAVLTGRSAATVRGVDLANPNDPVEFVVPEAHRFGPIRGINVRRTEVRKSQSRPWHGIRIARPQRIALDLLLRLSPRTRGWVRRLRIAVPDLDAFLRFGMVHRGKLSSQLRRSRNRGIVLARQALWMSDTRAESLPESELRVVLSWSLIPVTPQYKVIHTGRYLGRLDLRIDDEMVAVEYDGRWHLQPEQAAFDRLRRGRMEELGWTFVIIDADILAGDHRTLIDTVERARTVQKCS